MQPARHTDSNRTGVPVVPHGRIALFDSSTAGFSGGK